MAELPGAKLPTVGERCEALEGLKLPNKRVLSDVEDCRPRRSCIDVVPKPGEAIDEVLEPCGETCLRFTAEEGEADMPKSLNSVSDIASCRSSDKGA